MRTLVAPSANKSGRPSPTNAEHVREDFGIDFPVIDGESTKIGLESTVVDLSLTEVSILRPGSISKKQLEEILEMEIHESFFQTSIGPKSPGQKYSHYKPKAEVRWLKKSDSFNDTSILFLLMNSDIESNNIVNYQGDLTKFAKELYDRFRQADIEDFDVVVIESFDEIDHPMLSALLNRISKAIH